MRYVLASLLLCLCSTASATTTYLRLEGEIADDVIDPLVDAVNNAPSDRSDAVFIEINSPGGDVDAGFKLVKAIERYPAHVVCAVDGEADSMASYIFVSCDVRAMTRRSVLMIRQPMLGGRGQPNDIANMMDWITALTSSMAEHYAARMHISAVELAARVAGGRTLWLDWKAAQKLGAVDIVVDRVADLTRVCAF